MSAFRDDQIAALSAPLDRKHVKEREQAGRKLSYVEGWHVIAEANRIFGYGEWDRETVECRMVVEAPAKIGRPPNQRDGWRVSYVAKVRITVLPDGMRRIVREGTGYGSGIDADLGSAHESAIKEAETDGMKRGLMTFGNPFGLALYDKTQADVVTAPREQRPRSEKPPSDPDRTARVNGARERNARLKTAIENARLPSLIDEIISVNEADLAFVKEVHAPAYEALMQLAAARKTELVASA